jgi:porin
MMPAAMAASARRWPLRGILSVALMVFSSAAFAESVFSDRLTGDWGGVRTTLADHGVTLDFDWTNYYQGLLEGEGSKQFEYGGRIDALLNFDTGKLGLWEGGLLRTHTEYRYGDLNANLGGVLIATNAGLILPTGKKEEVIVTSIHLAQRFGDNVNLLLGRINAVDLIAADPFFGGAGQTRFMNVAFSAPPSGVTPAVIMGAVMTVKAAPFNWTFMVYDADDQTHDYWPDDLFGDGVNVSVTASYGGHVMGRTSAASVYYTYSTKDGTNLGELLLPPELQTGDKGHAKHYGVQFSHFLRENPEHPGEGFGLFLKIGASEGNPNPFQGSLIGGVSGKGLLDARPNDTFGLGYFYIDFSDALQSTLDPLVAFNDEQGVEAFYNFVVKDWLIVSADLQYVNPALGDTDNAFVGGLRARIRF